MPHRTACFYARRLHGDTTLRMIYSDSSFNTQIALSPDSKWLAFTSDHSGHSEVYVASFPDMQVKYPISQGGGTEPRWAHSGRELFFKSRGQLMSLPVAPGAGFSPGAAPGRSSPWRRTPTPSTGPSTMSRPTIVAS